VILQSEKLLTGGNSPAQAVVWRYFTKNMAPNFSKRFLVLTTNNPVLFVVLTGRLAFA
jgi:hypothetical protein